MMIIMDSENSYSNLNKLLVMFAYALLGIGVSILEIKCGLFGRTRTPLYSPKNNFGISSDSRYLK